MGTKSSVLSVLCTLPVELRNGGRHPFGDCTLRMELSDSHISHSLSSILSVQSPKGAERVGYMHNSMRTEYYVSTTYRYRTLDVQLYCTRTAVLVDLASTGTYLSRVQL